MPEERDPFVHEAGATAVATAADEKLQLQFRACARYGNADDAVELLRLVLDPSMWAAAERATRFDAPCRMLVAELALALMLDREDQPKLMAEVRKLVRAYR